MNEEKAIAILMANLKGSKKKQSNLLEIARACRLLNRLWGLKEMSNFFHVSEYMLRQIDKINDLDAETRTLVKKRRLGIDASYQLWRLDEKRRKEATKTIRQSTTEEIRAFVNLLHKYPKKSVDECKKEFDKNRDQNIKLLVLPLESKVFKQLKEIADKKGVTVHDFVIKLIRDHS